MRLRAWAERVLFGESLADKLWAPEAWVDEEPGAALGSVLAPGRPAGLELATTESLRLPPTEAWADPRVRGRLLHAFANHELLALELMALALLRFVDAPPGFRRGVAQTLSEEQRHLRAYLGRMRALGVELGEQPLGGFFWRAMAPMPSPLDFVAHMALTFEQANLDFARHHAAGMRAVGDEDTARILDEVHADEVGHVKLGLVWFERWRERGPSLFSAHRAALRAPLTLRRARGLGFDREGRRRAGLPAEYVEQLASFQASRGRLPVVHAFEPTAELSLGTRGAYTPPRAVRALTADLELLPAFGAHRDDVVLVSAAPSASHLGALGEAGLGVPEWVVVPGLDGPVPPEAVSHPRLAAVRPWGWGPRARARLSSLLPRSDLPAPPRSADAVLHAKTTWVGVRERLGGPLDEPWLDGPEDRGEVARALGEALAAVERLRARGHARVVIKAPHGTSGRGAERIDEAGPTPAQRGWLARTLAVQGAVVVEPWLRRVCDVSVRTTVDPSGEARVVDVGRFLTDPRGQYVGAVLGPLSRAVHPEVGRLLHDQGRDPERSARVFGALASGVGELVARHGYAGPVGIDGLVYRDRAGGLRLRPLVEVNVRPTLGHVAHGLGRRLAPGRAGLWVVFRLADLPAGCSAVEAVARARGALPLERGGNPPRLRQGAVPTTDPARAATVGTLLLVAERRAHALQALEHAMPTVAARVRRALHEPDAPA
ncbi:MAG: DUF455 family protein [Myxococcales bacterium]|nr:DUF455 family protein [Myxococcales bacterium]